MGMVQKRGQAPRDDGSEDQGEFSGRNTIDPEFAIAQMTISISSSYSPVVRVDVHTIYHDALLSPFRLGIE